MPPEYFSGRTVSDIVRLCIHKAADSGTDWGFGGAQLKVNGKDYYVGSLTDNPTWLEDGQIWCVPATEFPRVQFKAPEIECGYTERLPDEGPDKEYKCTIHAIGGEPPITWSITDEENHVFVHNLEVKTTDQKGRTVEFTGHTRQTNLNWNWNGTVTLTDAGNPPRWSAYNLAMRLINILPPPAIKSFNPTFGWPALSPAAPEAVIVNLESATDEDPEGCFDSRSDIEGGHQGSTRFFFQGSPSIGKDLVEAEVKTCTSKLAMVIVPQGAFRGPINVWTEFAPPEGVNSSESFTAHPNGYRFISGFSFSNGKVDDYFPSTFAWERFEQTFGTDEMWIQTPVGDKNIIPDPIAVFFYFFTRYLISEGCCHGFSLFALQLRQGIEAPGEFYKSGNNYPLDGYRTLWNLLGQNAPSQKLGNHIQSRQLVILSDEAISFYMDKILTIPDVTGELCNMNATYALDDMKQAISESLSNPRMISFAKNCSPFAGHVVVPYNVEPINNRENIRVYDPNRPAVTGDPSDGGSVFIVYPISGHWIYKRNNTDWEGLYMFTVPLTEYGYQHKWSLPGIGTLLNAAGSYMFGSAGGDEDTEIIQVKDNSGKTLYDPQGNVVQSKINWPEGVMFLPQFENVSESGRNVFALTKAVPLTFTIKARSNSFGMFSLIQGPFKSLSIENISTPLNIEFLPKNKSIHSVKVSPVNGSSSAIIRFSNRLPNAESLQYALRVNNMVASDPVELTSNRGAITMSAKTTPLDVDVEVTHTTRIGQVRILESDGVKVPAGALARFRVQNLEDLDDPTKIPIVFSLDPDGTGQNVTSTNLGEHLEGISIVAPHRIIVPVPPGTDEEPPGSLFLAEIDVSKSKTAFPHLKLKFSALADSQWSYEDGKIDANLSRGTQIVRIVAADGDGHRSFPKTIMVTVPEKGQIPTPLYTLFSQDARGDPNGEIKLPLGAYIDETPIIGIKGKISIEKQLSGLEGNMPKLGELALSSELNAVNAKINKFRANIRTLRFDITWDKDKPLRGKINLGQFLVNIPQDVPLGTSFLISCSGSILSKTDAGEQRQTLNGLPSLLSVWGGKTPGRIKINGPDKVSEESNILVTVVAIGIGVPPLPNSANNVGWWIDKVSGLANVQQSTIQTVNATVTGLKAGLVRVKVVVGTSTAEKIVRVVPK